MSANLGSSSGQEVDLNITPIIDCFTVLITFLLASASFLSIGFFETNTPGNASDPTQGEPDTELVVKINSNHVAEFKLKGKRNETVTFNLSDESSLANFDAKLAQIKTGEIKVNQVLLSADDKVDYQELSGVMGHINKANLPVVVGEF